MLRIVLGVIGGFLAWIILWFGTEQVLSAIFPVGFGAPQRAFQAAIENGGQFTADTKLLLAHLVMGSIVSLVSGALSALIAGGNSRAPLILGLLLLALAVMKAVMSWPYVPIWYHLLFTALTVSLVMIGGKLKSSM